MPKPGGLEERPRAAGPACASGGRLAECGSSTIRTRLACPRPFLLTARCRPGRSRSCSPTSRAARSCGRRNPEAMRVALARHDALVRDAIVSANGYVFKTVGDAFCAVVRAGPRCGRGRADAAKGASRGAVAARRRRSRCAWRCTPARWRARTATTSAPPLNRVARLLATGHGGQTLLSQTTYELARDSLPDAVSLRDLGAHRLKDLARPEQVYELAAPRPAVATFRRSGRCRRTRTTCPSS